MADKRRERSYVEHLRDVLPDFPAGTITPDEPPDFIVQSEAGERVGIEVTAFHLSPEPGQRPHQERQSLKNRVVALAWQHHAAAAGPELYVRVFFNDPASLTKGSAHETAGSLADAVLRTPAPTSFGAPSVRVPWADLPSSIGDVSINAAMGRALWTADGGGWVAPVQPDHVEAVITRKLAMAPVARAKVHTSWLVIVNDVFSIAAQAEISEAARTYRYEHPFDRLLWFEVHEGHAYDLEKRTEP